MDQVGEIFSKLEITASTSRARAHRFKEKENLKGDGILHFCAFCLEMCASHADLKKHFTKKKQHRVDKNEVKDDFQDAKKALDNNTDPTQNVRLEWNYKLHLAKVTMLERFS